MTPAGASVHARACGFIASQGLCSLPVNPFELIRRNRWGLVTYERLGLLSGPKGGVEALLGRSRDGFTVYNGRNYCIAYNSAVKNYNRVVFTLMHEVGHIVLGHFLGVGEGELTARQRELEEDASLFAGFVMAPSVVIARCGLLTPALLRAACGLSHEAAVRRLAQFEQWSPSEADRPVERLFDAYIKVSLAPRFNAGACEIV